MADALIDISIGPFFSSQVAKGANTNYSRSIRQYPSTAHQYCNAPNRQRQQDTREDIIISKHVPGTRYDNTRTVHQDINTDTVSKQEDITRHVMDISRHDRHMKTPRHPKDSGKAFETPIDQDVKTSKIMKAHKTKQD